MGKLEPGSSMAVLCELTRWKDPVLSGLVAGSGLLFLGALSCYSLIAVVAYFGLSLVLLGLGSKLYVQAEGGGRPAGHRHHPLHQPQCQTSCPGASAAAGSTCQGGVRVAKSEDPCQLLKRVKSSSLCPA